MHFEIIIEQRPALLSIFTDASTSSQVKSKQRQRAATNANVTQFLHHFKNGYSLLHVLHPVADIFYKTSGNAGFDTVTDENSGF